MYQQLNEQLLSGELDDDRFLDEIEDNYGFDREESEAYFRDLLWTNDTEMNPLDFEDR